MLGKLSRKLLNENVKPLTVITAKWLDVANLRTTMVS
jgi:hypothetical protein